MSGDVAGDDLVGLAHRARRCLKAHLTNRKAAQAMGMTVPTFMRHLKILEFPVEALAAYRHGRISPSLMWKLTRQPEEKLRRLWAVLGREGRLKHDDLKALKGDNEVLMRRLQVTARKLKAAGWSKERICELVAEA